MLKLEMRVTEVREIAQFELAGKESLEDRVKAELNKAIEQGSVPSATMRATVPPVRVRDTTEGNSGSMAVFDYAGTEVTDRAIDVQVQETEVGDTYLLSVKDNDGAEEELIGTFVREDIAHRVGALWRAGLLD